MKRIWHDGSMPGTIQRCCRGSRGHKRARASRGVADRLTHFLRGMFQTGKTLGPERSSRGVAEMADSRPRCCAISPLRVCVLVPFRKTAWMIHIPRCER